MLSITSSVVCLLLTVTGTSSFVVPQSRSPLIFDKENVLAKRNPSFLTNNRPDNVKRYVVADGPLMTAISDPSTIGIAFGFICALAFAVANKSMITNTVASETATVGVTEAPSVVLEPKPLPEESEPAKQEEILYEETVAQVPLAKKVVEVAQPIQEEELVEEEPVIEAAAIDLEKQVKEQREALEAERRRDLADVKNYALEKNQRLAKETASKELETFSSPEQEEGEIVKVSSQEVSTSDSKRGRGFGSLVKTSVVAALFFVLGRRMFLSLV